MKIKRYVRMKELPCDVYLYTRNRADRQDYGGHLFVAECNDEKTAKFVMRALNRMLGRKA